MHKTLSRRLAHNRRTSPPPLVWEISASVICIYLILLNTHSIDGTKCRPTMRTHSYTHSEHSTRSTISNGRMDECAAAAMAGASPFMNYSCCDHTKWIIFHVRSPFGNTDTMLCSRKCKEATFGACIFILRPAHQYEIRCRLYKYRNKIHCVHNWSCDARRK